jgi:hypothetical protein
MCNCAQRKQELADRGIPPLLGLSYGSLDAARWALMKAGDKILGSI